MTKLFTAYRILAIAVGVFLLAACISYLVHDIWWLWMLHGYVYIAYLLVAVPFIRKAGWSVGFFALVIVAGLVPVLMFFVEHFVSKKYKSEHPELYPVAA